MIYLYNSFIFIYVYIYIYSKYTGIHAYWSHLSRLALEGLTDGLMLQLAEFLSFFSRTSDLTQNACTYVFVGICDS